MMGRQSVPQEPLFYGFDLNRHVPADHLLRAIDRSRQAISAETSSFSTQSLADL